jgi:hypothetical protein
VPKGQEWLPYAGLSMPATEVQRFIESTPIMAKRGRQLQRNLAADVIPVPPVLTCKKSPEVSEGLGASCLWLEWDLC